MLETVSAIVAVYNGERYLQEALESMLAQTVPPDEIIVIDDGSTDASAAIAGSMGGAVRMVTQANAGQAAALAHGVSLATGTYLAFNDADDLWAPGKQETQLAAFAADPALELVYGLCEQFVSPELDEDEQRRYAPAAPTLPGALLQAVLVRRTAFDRVGGINPAMRGAGATDWMGRAVEAGLVQSMLPHPVLHRRLHATNYGRIHAAERDRNLLAVLRDKIRRSAAQQQQ